MPPRHTCFQSRASQLSDSTLTLSSWLALGTEFRDFQKQRSHDLQRIADLERAQRETRESHLKSFDLLSQSNADLIKIQASYEDTIGRLSTRMEVLELHIRHCSAGRKR